MMPSDRMGYNNVDMLESSGNLVQFATENDGNWPSSFDD